MTKKISAITLLLFCFNTNATAQETDGKPSKTKKYNPTSNLVVWPEEFNPATASWFVYNEIEIKAKPEVVWNILIDAKKWHTFYKGVESPVNFISDTNTSTLKNGLRFTMHTMGLHLQPVIKEFVPNERMAWEVRRNNLTAYHAWVIVPTENGCKLITPEAQNGFLTFLQKVFQPNKLLNLHQHWLEVIKAKAEETTPQLNDMEKNTVKSILISSRDKFNSVVHSLSAEQLNFKSATDKWSIAECIEHIALAELALPKILEKELQQPSNPAMRSKIKIKDDEIRPAMTSRKWKAKSPDIFKPSNKFNSTNEAIIAFQRQRDNTIAYVETTKDDLRNHFWEHPLTGKIDLYQMLILTSAHAERHIEQIEIIKLSSDFPRK